MLLSSSWTQVIFLQTANEREYLVAWLFHLHPKISVCSGSWCLSFHIIFWRFFVQYVDNLVKGFSTGSLDPPLGEEGPWNDSARATSRGLYLLWYCKTLLMSRGPQVLRVFGRGCKRCKIENHGFSVLIEKVKISDNFDVQFVMTVLGAIVFQEKLAILKTTKCCWLWRFTLYIRLKAEVLMFLLIISCGFNQGQLTFSLFFFTLLKGLDQLFSTFFCWMEPNLDSQHK